MIGCPFIVTEAQIELLVETLAASIRGRQLCRRCQADAPGRAPGSSRAPPSGESPISSRPPWAAATSAVTARPSPAPPPSRPRPSSSRTNRRTTPPRRSARDAGTVVVDVDGDVAVVDLDRRRPPRRGVTGGVGDEVVEGPPHGVLVADRRDRRRRPTATSTGTRRRRAATSRTTSAIATDLGRTARSSPRASSSRSSTRPCRRSSSPSSTALVASQSVAATVPGDLQLGAHHRHRRAQLVRGVGHEAPARRRRRLQAAEHAVHRRRQLGDLVVDAGTGTRSCSECEPIAATRDVTAWTGRSARPASSQASPATRATSAGPMIHSSRRVVAIVSRTSSSGDAVASVTPPTVNVDTSNVAGSPGDAEQLGAGHRHRRRCTTTWSRTGLGRQSVRRDVVRTSSLGRPSPRCAGPRRRAARTPRPTSASTATAPAGRPAREHARRPAARSAARSALRTSPTSAPLQRPQEHERRRRPA